MVRGKRQAKRDFHWQWYALAGCIGMALIFGFLLVRDLVLASKEQKANDQLAQQVQEIREAISLTAPSESSGVLQPEPLPKYAPSGNLYQYDALWQENQDMAGWLFIWGTRVDLPVMCTPKRPEFYLRRAFDGSYALSGSLFLNPDWTPEANHAIIYGHKMKNGTMFGELELYADETYAKAHPIRFDTLTEEREYDVLAAFYSRVYTDRDRNVFRYYQYTDLSEESTFVKYVSQVRTEGLYDTGLEVQFGDRLLTLSTCSYHQENGRFVVVAVQNQEEVQED